MQCAFALRKCSWSWLLYLMSCTYEVDYTVASSFPLSTTRCSCHSLLTQDTMRPHHTCWPCSRWLGSLEQLTQCPGPSVLIWKIRSTLLSKVAITSTGPGCLWLRVRATIFSFQIQCSLYCYTWHASFCLWGLQILRESELWDEYCIIKARFRNLLVELGMARICALHVCQSSSYSELLRAWPCHLLPSLNCLLSKVSTAYSSFIFVSARASSAHPHIPSTHPCQAPRSREPAGHALWVLRVLFASCPASRGVSLSSTHCTTQTVQSNSPRVSFYSL